MLACHGTSLFIALVLFCSTAKAVALTGLAPTAKAAESRQMMRAEDEVAMLIQSDGKVKAMEYAKTSSTDQQLPAQMPIRAQAAPVIYAAPVASASTAAFPGVQVVAGPSAMAGQPQYTVPTVQSQQANGWQPQYIAAPARNGDLPYASVYSAPTVAMPSNVAASSMQSMPQIPASSVRAQLQNIPPVWGTLAPPSQTAPIPQQVVPSTPSAAQPPQSAVAPAAPPKVIEAAKGHTSKSAEASTAYRFTSGSPTPSCTSRCLTTSTCCNRPCSAALCSTCGSGTASSASITQSTKLRIWLSCARADTSNHRAPHPHGF